MHLASEREYQGSSSSFIAYNNVANPLIKKITVSMWIKTNPYGGAQFFLCYQNQWGL
jgi:hypothetical protein